MNNYPSNFKTQLRKNERFFKYFDYSYRSRLKVSYANVKHLSYKKARVLLVNKARENAVEKN